jgi:4-hydroxybenzoate polyprenyltransferase
VVRTLVYANIFISLCAFAQVLITYHLFPIPFNFDNNSYLLFVFLATYLQYNLQRGYSITQLNLHTDRSLWLAKHKKIMLISALLSLIILLFLCNGLSWTSIIIMGAAEVVSNLYYLPPFNLRKYGYIKPFLISIIWVISCCLVPLIENQLFTMHSLWFMASQCLFIGVLCMLFDMKDADDDYVNGVNTYANKFGLKPTKILCIALTIISCGCFYRFMPEPASLIRIVIVGLFTVMAVLLTDDRKHAFYYYLFVDGLLLIQTALFFV